MSAYHFGAFLVHKSADPIPFLLSIVWRDVHKLSGSTSRQLHASMHGLNSQHSMLQDLEQRYNKLRVEVQMAQDADEAVTLDEAVRRVMRKEKQTAPVFAGARPSRNASKANPSIPGNH